MTWSAGLLIIRTLERVTLLWGREVAVTRARRCLLALTVISQQLDLPMARCVHQFNIVYQVVKYYCDSWFIVGVCVCVCVCSLNFVCSRLYSN